MTHTRRKPVRRQPLRLAVQIGFFVVIAVIAINHTLVESGADLPLLTGASLHSVCPFGGVVTIYQYATTGRFVQKIHESAFVLMFAGFALAVLVGPAFCGWACPMGSVQEWIGKLGRRIFRRRYNRFVPYQVDRWLRYLRYLVLAWVLFVTAWSAKLVFADYDPYFALFNFWSNEVAWSALAILGLVLVLSLFVERPFCKYACPYGATLGLFNLIRIFPIRRNAKSCITCRLCDVACPMNIPVSGKEVIRDHQCISCLKCTSEYSCPVTNTVEMQVMRFKEVDGLVEERA